MKIGDAGLAVFAVAYLWAASGIPFWHLWVAVGVAWAMNVAQMLIRDYRASKKAVEQ